MIGVRLEPVDTWFFRDGTPFAADSAPQDGVASLFPPHPASVAGALRAALARCNGWNGAGRWPTELDAVLGDGPDDIGALSVDGPFLLRDGQPLFRAPRHLLGSTDAGAWTPRVLLRPGPETVCDLGDAVRLPEAPRTADEIETLEAGGDWWLTGTGMETVLRGHVPPVSAVAPSRELWREEARIGLERGRHTRTAVERMLYSTRHVRLARGVSLGARLRGLPAGWTPPFGRLAPLGGESRLAECAEWQVEPLPALSADEIDDRGRVTFIALTPLDLDHEICRGEKPLALPGDARIVSACLSRPQRIGGWDSLQHEPRPIRSVLPPGSVLFCEVAEPRRFVHAVRAADGMVRMGARQRWGFGLVALGVWPDEEEGDA